MMNRQDDFIVDPRSTHSIFKEVSKVKIRYGLQDKLFVNIPLLLDMLTNEEPIFDYIVVPDSEMPVATYADYNPALSLLRIAESVYNGACKNNGRDIFTIAHEIGHHFLHQKTTTLKRAMPGITKIYYTSEWQANTFASLFLMNPDLILSINDAAEISSICCTSYEAAEIALRNAKKAKHKA